MRPTSSERSSSSHDNSIFLKRCTVLALAFVLLPFLLKHAIVRDDTDRSKHSFFGPLDNLFSNEDSLSRTSSNRHRELLFLQRNDYCRRAFNVPGEVYQTVTVLRVVSIFTQIFYPNDVPGTCGEVCADVCDHQPCTDDFVSPDDSLCECLPGGEIECSTYSFCAEETETCTCNTGYEGNPLAGCVDINECRNTTICGSSGTCVNVPGSYQCECKTGYKNSPSGACVDINECVEAPPCGPDSTCNNTIGSFKCGCKAGFTGNPPTTLCIDVNECSSSPCGPNATACTNTVGSYNCTCSPGFKDSSPSGGCVNINECKEGGSTCNPTTEACVDTVGSFRCTCAPGYQGQPGSCSDVDECATGSICGPNASCTNFVGNFTCVCNPGFLGGSPPQCRKLNAYEKCPGPDSDCSSGLECSITSRSDNRTSCCPTGTAYACQVNERCCSGAYTEGEACPSQLDIDCRDDLKCARRGGQYVCCDRVVVVGSVPICL